MILGIMRICSLCFIMLLKDSHSITSFENVINEIVPYLHNYNDISIYNLIVVYPIDQSSDLKYRHSYCLEEDDILSRVNMWVRCVPLSQQNNSSLTFIKELEHRVNSLIILDFIPSSSWFQQILNNLPTNLFIENALLILNPNSIISNNSTSLVTSECKHIAWFDKVDLESQIYVFKGNSTNGVLFEMYRPCQSHDINIQEVLRISNSKCLPQNPEFIWKRRQNLMGCEFGAGYIEQKYGFYEIDDHEHCPRRISGVNKIICLADRWYTSLVNQLITDLNIKLSFVSPKDNQYGIRYENTTNWTGVVGLLQQGKVEFGFALLTFTPDRDEVMDFGLDLGFEYLILYMAKPKTSISHISYNDVFNVCYWILLVGTGILVCICFAILKNFNKETQYDSREKLNLQYINAGISLTYRALLGLDVYSSKHLNRIPTKMSIRICLLTACLLGMLNRDTFYAGLASLLTIEPPSMPITSLEDVLKSPGYRLSVMEGTTIESYFSDSDDSIAQRLWNEKESKIISNNGKIMAEKQILSDPKLIYVGTESFQEVSMNFPCKITKLSKMYGQQSFGFGFRTNSPYQKLFNYKISQYRTFGIKSHLKRDTEKANIIGCDETNEHWHALGLFNIPLPFEIVLIGVGTALLLLSFEAIFHYKTMRSKIIQNRQSKETRHKHSIDSNQIIMHNMKTVVLSETRRRISF